MFDGEQQRDGGVESALRGGDVTGGDGHAAGLDGGVGEVDLSYQAGAGLGVGDLGSIRLGRTALEGHLHLGA